MTDLLNHQITVGDLLLFGIPLLLILYVIPRVIDAYFSAQQIRAINNYYRRAMGRPEI